jgi:hypothetical protein
MTALTFVLMLLSIYPWPLRPFNESHPVSAVLGDARGTLAKPRFHRGIDIPANAGTNVFPIYSGRANRTQTGDGIYVGNFWYIHLDPNTMVQSGTQVIGILDTVNTSPTRIGDVAGDHLHFQIGNPNTDGPYLNPLSYDNGPVGYSDTDEPVVWGSTEEHWWFWRQGSEGVNAVRVESPLWGKIDIRVFIQDTQTSANRRTTTGIYKTAYLIQDIQGNTLYGPVYTIIFPQVQPPNNGSPVLLVYDRHNYRARSPFYYWVTNRIVNNNVINAYWNTRLKKGEPWNGTNAWVSSQAYTPDGRVRVWVLAYDIKGNGGDMVNRRGAEDEVVIIDNFVPYLEHVIIYNQNIYEAEWSGPIDDYNLGDLKVYSQMGCVFCVNSVYCVYSVNCVYYVWS